MRDREEQDAVREQYAATPGVGGQVEALLGQRENNTAYGYDNEPVDSALSQLGYEAKAAAGEKAAAARKAAAAERAEAKAQAATGEGRAQPPEGRHGARHSRT